MNIDMRYTAIITAVLLIVTLVTMQFWMPYIAQWVNWIGCISTSMDTCCGTLCCGAHP